MKFVLVLALLGACYQPASETAACTIRCPDDVCPNRMECIAGYCGGCDDPPGSDASTVCDLAAFTADPIELLLKIEDTPQSSDRTASYTIGGGNPGYAAMQVDDLRVNAGPPDQALVDPVLMSDASLVYRAAHLAPDRDEVFVQTYVAQPDVYEVRVATRNLGMWSNPVPVTMLGANQTQISFASDEVPSTPTLPDGEGHRHMIIQINGNFLELVNTSDNVWTTEQTFTRTNFALSVIRDPQLSPDGLTLVFTGSINQMFSLYGAQRLSLTQPFEHIRLIRTDPAGERPYHPFLTADCLHLYFYLETPGVVRIDR